MARVKLKSVVSVYVIRRVLQQFSLYPWIGYHNM